jgi:hypothetical protein
MQRRQTGFPELGLPDQQPVVRNVGNLQLQRFGDPQPGDRQQGDQSGVGLRSQPTLRTKAKGGFNQAIDLVRRVDVRRSALLAGAKVIGRRHLMPTIFNPDESHEAADGFQPRVTLCHRWAESRPVDRRLRVNMRFLASSRKASKALQQAFRSFHLESCGTAQAEVGLNGVQHQSASGQGCAISFNRLTSALA